MQKRLCREAKPSVFRKNAMDSKGYALWRVEGTQYPQNIAPPGLGEGQGWGRFLKKPSFCLLRENSFLHDGKIETVNAAVRTEIGILPCRQRSLSHQIFLHMDDVHDCEIAVVIAVT